MFDHIVKEVTIVRQIGVVGKGAAQGLAIVMVSRNDVDRYRQIGQDLSQCRIFLAGTLADEVSRRHHHVRTRVECVQVGDRTGEKRVRVDDIVVAMALRDNVWIGDLGDNHGSFPSGVRARSVSESGLCFGSRGDGGSSFPGVRGASLELRPSLHPAGHPVTEIVAGCPPLTGALREPTPGSGAPSRPTPLWARRTDPRRCSDCRG